MNLEEARNNIGAEVELDESTKPYTFIDDDEVLKAECSIIKGSMEIFSCMNDGNVVVVSDDGVVKEWYLPHHLKIKPQNYKIHVPTEAESKEAQELFFELGYEWVDSGKTVGLTEAPPYLYAFSSGCLGFDRQIGANHFKCHQNKQITLQELRDMVVKKKGIKSIGVDLAIGEDKTLQLTGTFTNFEPCKEMTWEDALDAFKEGKEVEVKNISWFNIKDLKLENIKRGTAFRVVTQRITLNGEYTKEELLQKAGEME